MLKFQKHLFYFIYASQHAARRGYRATLKTDPTFVFQIRTPKTLKNTPRVTFHPLALLLLLHEEKRDPSVYTGVPLARHCQKARNKYIQIQIRNSNSKFRDCLSVSLPCLLRGWSVRVRERTSKRVRGTGSFKPAGGGGE